MAEAVDVDEGPGCLVGDGHWDDEVEAAVEGPGVAREQDLESGPVQGPLETRGRGVPDEGRAEDEQDVDRSRRIGRAGDEAGLPDAAGGIGVLTLGMMARVSLGHSGRLLESAPLMTWAFVAINLAALIRVAVPIVVPQAYAPGMTLSGLAWMAAFGLFTVIYAPFLLRPRADGKPG